MTQQSIVRCTNCGTEWALEARSIHLGGASVSEPTCPVCHLPLSTGETSPLRLVSADDLETQLRALMSSARASGLDTEVIVQVLRDELEFAAEMGHAGRRFSVQLIDLGPQEGEILNRPVRDRREILQHHSVSSRR
jgi:hypothetical protein